MRQSGFSSDSLGRTRVLTAATIAGPLLCVVLATAAYRVFEIPAVRPSYSTAVIQADDSPSARETSAMYASANRLLSGHLSADETGTMTITSRDDSWLEGIQLFLTASRRDTCYFHHWNDIEPSREFEGIPLTRAVLAEAAYRTEHGELDGRRGITRWYLAFGVAPVPAAIRDSLSNAGECRRRRTLRVDCTVG